MRTLLKIRNIENLKTKAEIKAAVRKLVNGEYVTKICLNCGAYYVHPESKTENAVCIDRCNDCTTVGEIVNLV